MDEQGDQIQAGRGAGPQDVQGTAPAAPAPAAPGAAVVTLAATPMYLYAGHKDAAFWCLYAGSWIFSLANGACESVINPLTATLFPRAKTHWLNILHAGWPGGLILGTLIAVGFGYLGSLGVPVRWEVVKKP